METLNIAKKSAVLWAIFAVFILAIFLSLGNGAVKISISEISAAMISEEVTANRQIIWNVRFPRTVAAILVGVALSLSGAILQGIMRNPLAGPNIIGVSAGGGFFGLLILILFPQYFFLVPFGAFVGALSATMVIYLLAWKDGVMPSRLILAGVAISSIFGAGNNALMTFYPERVSGVLGFMVGGLSAITWRDVNMVYPFILTGVAAALLLPGKLNILLLGDDVATGLGMRVERTRLFAIGVSSLLAGAAVSVVGMLGFVGLMVPHITRIFLGSDHRYLIPGSMLMGGTILLLCDTLARVMFAPMEIPVGIIMSSLGAPFFLYLLRKGRGHHGS
ncbi:FecCD family ABC transporter permease [Gudongella sp. SC589]|jgi:iron complex transport system permease protein|uniref:FecCD family ABC transporter permease n=1 Tax=Gudongella sp. SC589 TaxID=3385990 RepID=UPI003904A8D5